MPGVRAIRAPLAAGFVLLLSAWIAFESSVPEHPTEGIWASLERLQPLASAVGTVGLIAFVAYVVGSLYLVPVTNRHRFATPARERFGRVDWAPRRRRDVDALFDNARSGTDVEFAEDFESAASEFEELVQRNVSSLLAPPLSAENEERLLQYVRAHLDVLRHPEDREWLSEWLAPWTPVSDYVDGETVLAWRTLARIYIEQWDTLPLKLVGTQPHLYSEIDRFQSEAEFRLALVGPLALLAVVVGVRAGGWGIAIGAAIGILVAVILVYAIHDSQYRANTVLVNGIAAGLVLRGPAVDSR